MSPELAAALCFGAAFIGALVGASARQPSNDTRHVTIRLDPVQVNLRRGNDRANQWSPVPSGPFRVNLSEIDVYDSKAAVDDLMGKKS